MSSVSTRRAPKSQGGLARLVSKFENLGTSKTPQDIGSAGEINDSAASKFSDAPPVQKNARDRVVGSSKTLASPSLTPTTATRDQLETPLRDNHAGSTAPPSSKIGKLISRRGLAVADMRRLFERGNVKTVTSNVARTTTYEPKYVASPTKTTECNDHKPLSLASSPMKGSSTVNLAGTLANGQEERDIVPDLVEHPEYLPRPLTSPDRFSRPSTEDKAVIEDNKSTWQRNEPRFKIRGGVFLHNAPAPLQNMVVTDVGTWRPNPLDTSELVLHSEDGKLRNDDQHLVHSFERVKGDGPGLLEDLQTDAVNDEQPLLQKQAEQAERAPKSSLETPSKPIIFQQSSVRLTSTQDGTRFGTLSGTGRKLKETIGLFESMSHQTNRDDRFGNIPKISSSPTFQRTAATKGKLASDKLERAAAKSEDVPPPPRLLSPIEDQPPRPYARSPGVDSASSQASDIKPLLYTTPSMIKTRRHEKHFGSLFRSGWRRKAKLRSEDGAVQRQGYNIDGEAGFDFEQKYHKISCDETWTDGSEASSITHEPMIADRHPSLRLLRRRLMSRSHGLFVSEAHCTLEQPQPVRSNELRNLPSLFRERIAVLRARAQTE
ncbi:hypothetical protein A0O28_0102430 [Trichoderma guizhouense]|uniref:Uncharacterized protein n=1 Tax=Trichoderma guizhouense TaxID=1491466 RepID=A0A1T3CKS2_9HYPO|nr:hypothetical protein A0O28_0102430 [Trichoderma guizhouense]